MRSLIVSFFVLFFFSSVGQSSQIVSYKNIFERELKEWTKSFDHFDLSIFKFSDTLYFDNIDDMDFRTYKKFMSVYKSIVSYDPGKAQFIDIYSYQLNLEKRGKHYYANTDIDQAIYLCNPTQKYWKRIFFGSTSRWIDDIVWLSKTQFILVGITKTNGDKKLPLILLGDTKSQTLLAYSAPNENCFQHINGYQSYKLKRLKIKGL